MSFMSRVAGLRPLHWVLVFLPVLIIDYFTGPLVGFAMLMVLPVALATARHGLKAGAVLALVLPILGFLPYLVEKVPWWRLEAAETAIEIAVLLAFAGLLGWILQLEGRPGAEEMLPMCAFCKRLRDPAGQWQPVELFIGRQTGTRLSHTFCPDCKRSHYPPVERRTLRSGRRSPRD